MHYTPKHGSWLNQAEIEISLFFRQCLGKRRIPTLEIFGGNPSLERHANRQKVTIDWKFTRKGAPKFGYKGTLMRS